MTTLLKEYSENFSGPIVGQKIQNLNGLSTLALVAVQLHMMHDGVAKETEQVGSMSGGDITVEWSVWKLQTVQNRSI
jgi:hypothetical protein